jgi:hypothetical protein
MASRTLAVLFAVYALGEASGLPEFVHWFRHSISCSLPRTQLGICGIST